ncbi:MAG: PIN domain-containing protein [Ginsengibacter sp.]
MKPTIMINDVCAVDTNVLIYLHDKSDERKRRIAKEILAENPKISTQVISEYLNTTRRILDLLKAELLIQGAELLKDCEIIYVTTPTLLSAARLIKKYNFQLFDSIIVAASLEGNCSVLFSEDMQHGLVVEKKLTIVNPFV